MNEVKKVKKKLVTVRCYQPFSYNNIPFVGICNKVVLDVDAIKYALGRKALVSEHLKNGQTIPLGFDNFDTWNGPTVVDDQTEILSYVPQEIEMIDGFGNKKTINKKQDKVEQKVIHIDLEAERIEAEIKEQERKEKEEQEKKRLEEIERVNRIKAEQAQRDSQARKEAIDKIISNAKKESSHKENQDLKKTQFAEEQHIKDKEYYVDINSQVSLASNDHNEDISSSLVVVDEKSTLSSNEKDNYNYYKKNKKK